MELISSGTTTTLLASVSTAVGTTATTLWPIVAVAVGLPLAFWAIAKIIGVFKHAMRGGK
jgi:hypothetical protein